MNPHKQLRLICSSLILGLTLTLSAPSLHANVYATNIKINGGVTNLTVDPGTSLSIGYILNEPASAGVTIKILSGSTAVRTVTLTNGGPGTLRGTNSVTWDGKNDQGQNLSGCNYTVSITAASKGYPVWTATTDDTNPGNYTWEARGIAVDRNTNSPYYGRVFVDNSVDNTAASSLPGDSVGLLKLNADGSFADEGGFTTGGIDWSTGEQAPWKIRVSADDQVYVSGFTEGGTNAGNIYRFDGALSTNSMVQVFTPTANTSLGEWTGFCVTGSGTNTILWGADDRVTNSLGIVRFALQTNGTFDVMAGTQVVSTNPAGSLAVGPFAVSVGSKGSIYTLQQTDVQWDNHALVLRFPAYDPATNNGTAETQADWTAGPGDAYCGARGLAVDPTGTYVAACFWGYEDFFFPVYTSGNIRLLNATNGTVVTNLDLGIAFPTTPGGESHHQDTDCDWDAVGNLYYLDDWNSCWRAMSPPGANQATTVALSLVQVGGGSAPVITSIVVSNGIAKVYFTAGATDPASAFELYGASNVSGPYTLLASAVITGSGGHYLATVATNSMPEFFDVRRVTSAPQAPQIQRLQLNGSNVVISFTGASSDSASAFTVLSSSTVNGAYTAAASAVVTGSNGTFQATVPMSDPAQFYRIRR